MKIPLREMAERWLKTVRPHLKGSTYRRRESSLRKGEANAFKWREIDGNRGLFAVTGGAEGTKNHDERMVPLFPSMVEFLDRRMGRP